MSSSSFLTKSMPCRSLFRLSKTFLSTSNNYVQCTYATSNFKPHIYAKMRNENVEKTNKKAIDSVEESDQFGTLRKPLEKDFNSSSYSSKQDKKKILIKKPQNDESEIFGNLSEKRPFWYSDFNEEPKINNDMSDDSVIIKTFGKRYRCPEKYLSEMKDLVKQKKVKFIFIVKKNWNYSVIPWTKI